MTHDASENGHKHPVSEQDQIARAEFVAYAATIIPELITLVASEPELVTALEEAHRVAMKVVSRMEGTPVWKKAGLPPLTTT